MKDARVRAQDNIGRHTQPERNGLTQPAGTSGRTTHELQDSVREVLRRSAHLFDDSAVRSGESEDEHQRNEAGTRHRRVRRDRARRVLSLTFRRRGGGEENANVYGDNLPTAGEEKKNNVNENRGHRRLGGFHRRRLSTPSNAHSNKLEDQTRAPLASANVHAPCDQNLKAVSVKEECNKLREMLRKEQVTSRAAVEQVQSLKVTMRLATILEFVVCVCEPFSLGFSACFPSTIFVDKIMSQILFLLAMCTVLFGTPLCGIALRL